MRSFYHELMTTDFSVLTDLAKKWGEVVDAIDGLPGRVHKELVKPLRDEGYWEGAAAPYAWQMIDDMQRQVQKATDVARKVKKVLEDGEHDLSELRKDVKAVVKRAEDDGQGLIEVTSHGVVRSTGKGARSPGTTDMVESFQNELNGVLRGGVFIDSKLAYALMSNVGLDQWFNSKPKHTNLDSTGSISPADFDAYTRVMNGESPHAEPNNATPRSTGWAWLLGKGEFEPGREFHQGDKFLEQLRRSDSMMNVHNETLAQYKEGKLEGVSRHKISGLSRGEQIESYVKDMTGLSGIDNLWGGKTNEAQSLLGSYAVRYKVMSEEPDGSIVVRYTLNNDTDIESFTPGYGTWQENLNKEQGLGAEIHEKMTWTERIHPVRAEPADGK